MNQEKGRLGPCPLPKTCWGRLQLTGIQAGEYGVFLGRKCTKDGKKMTKKGLYKHINSWITAYWVSANDIQGCGQAGQAD